MKNKRKTKQEKDIALSYVLNNKKTSAGITLIALVVTIVVLLILAGVTLNLVIGNNGIITKAKDAAKKTKMAEVKDRIGVMIGEYRIEEYTGTTTLKDFLDNKVTTGEIDAVTETDEGYDIEKDGYIINVDKDGNIIGEPSKTGVRPQVSDIKVVANSNGTGENLGAKSTDEGTTLYITFTHGIEGGTTTVSPALPFAVTSNGAYTFTVTGTVEGETKTKNVKVTVNQFTSAFKIGDYVNYTYDEAEKYVLTSDTCGSSSNPADGIPQTTGLKWRILNIDESTGKIDLVSETPTNTSVYFSGAKGYNNGVYLLNDMCAKQYSNSSLGITARSINLEDTEKHLTETGLAARNAYTYNGIKYGDTKTYTSSSYRKYPLLWKKQNGSGLDLDLTGLDPTATDYQDKVREKLKKDGISESDSYYSEPTTETYTTAETGITVQQTGYDNITFNNTNYGEAGAVLNSSNSYWVASRYAYCYSDYVDFGANFGLRRAGTYMINHILFVSRGGEYSNGSYDNRVRPVVSLGSDLLDGTKDASGAWNLKTSR